MDFGLYMEEDFRKNPDSFVCQLDSLNDLDTCLLQIGTKLDQVEIDLMKEVAAQSSTFHSALSTIQELKDSIQCLSSTTEQVSLQLFDFRHQLDLSTQDLNDLYARQKNLTLLQIELEKIAAILKLRNKIQDLVNKSSFDEALFLIKKAKKEIQEHYSDLRALDNLYEELMEMMTALEKLKLTPIDPTST